MKILRYQRLTLRRALFVTGQQRKKFTEVMFRVSGDVFRVEQEDFLKTKIFQNENPTERQSRYPKVRRALAQRRTRFFR